MKNHFIILSNEYIILPTSSTSKSNLCGLFHPCRLLNNIQRSILGFIEDFTDVYPQYPQVREKQPPYKID